MRCTRVGRSWNSNKGEGFVPDSHGAAGRGGAAARKAHIRDPQNRKQSLPNHNQQRLPWQERTNAREAGGRLRAGIHHQSLGGCYWRTIRTRLALGGNVSASQSGNARWRLHWQLCGDKGV